MATVTPPINRITPIDGSTAPHTINLPTSPNPGDWVELKLISPVGIGNQCDINAAPNLVESIDGDGYVPTTYIGLDYESVRFVWLPQDEPPTTYHWNVVFNYRSFPFPQEFFLVADSGTISPGGTLNIPLSFNTQFIANPIHWTVQPNGYDLLCNQPFRGYAEIGAWWVYQAGNNQFGDMQIRAMETNNSGNMVVQDIYGVVGGFFGRGNDAPASGYTKFIVVADPGDILRLQADVSAGSDFGSYLAAGTNIRLSTL